MNKKHSDMENTIKRLHQKSASVTSNSVSKENYALLEEDDPANHSHSSSSTNLFTLQMSVTAKDRRIVSLESTVSELESQLQILIAEGNPHLRHLEAEVAELKESNIKLREDINGYQTLLQDKTVSGEFAQSQFMQASHSSTKYESMRGKPNQLDLAAELENLSQHSDVSVQPQQIEKADRSELESKVLELQETNKALQLYVSTMLEKMLGTPEFVHLLSKDTDADTVQSAKPVIDQCPAPSFLQRTKSVLSRRPIGADMTGTPVKNDAMLLPSASSGNILTISSLERKSTPSPHRAVEEHHRRALSPSSNRSPPSIRNGLRPLASGVAADRISAKEARRLSAQFAPMSTPLESAHTGPHQSNTAQNKRSTWLGWLSGQSEKGEPFQPLSPRSVTRPFNATESPPTAGSVLSRASAG